MFENLGNLAQADALTEEQIAKIQASLRDVAWRYVTVGTIGGRAAIFQKGGDAVQFIVHPSSARHLLAEWDAHFEMQEQKAGGR